jgi:hypothetical protein
MKITLHGKTEDVFQVEINTEIKQQFTLRSTTAINGMRDTISANMHYIDEIVEMLLEAKRLLEDKE